MSRIIRETDPSVGILRKALDEFYANYADYDAFSNPTNVAYFWSDVVLEIRHRISAGGVCSVLEIGTGKTGFPSYLEQCDLRLQTSLTLHDVTPINRKWLLEQGDQVIVGPVEEITGWYDIVFSTFVLEHMTDPERSLRHMATMLKHGGVIMLVAPRYDVPFYLPPSCAHMKSLERFTLALQLVFKRICSLIAHRSDFFILNDPAIFHLPWKRDRDAVHLVSFADIQFLAQSIGMRARALRIKWVPFWRQQGFKNREQTLWWHLGYIRGNIKDWIVRRYLMIGIKMYRIDSQSNQ